jgi:hypothetical protein
MNKSDAYCESDNDKNSFDAEYFSDPPEAENHEWNINNDEYYWQRPFSKFRN